MLSCGLSGWRAGETPTEYPARLPLEVNRLVGLAPGDSGCGRGRLAKFSAFSRHPRGALYDYVGTLHMLLGTGHTYNHDYRRSQFFHALRLRVTYFALCIDVAKLHLLLDRGHTGIRDYCRFLWCRA